MSQPAQEDRNREHPRERFAFREKVFDLDQLTHEIEREPLSSPHVRQGHRQITLIRDHPETVALYTFEKDGYLVEHSVDGMTTIHVLDGLIEIETDETTHQLSSGQVLILDENVPHRVEAKESSRMLLTISRDANRKES